MSRLKRADPVISTIMAERNQGHDTRRAIFSKIEKHIERPLLTYFTSFVSQVAIDDGDVDMLEDILQRMDLSRGLAVMISSPGGSGLSAERIVNLLRTYSGTKEYWAIVPSRAKSAATMICMGASKIIMGPSAELGPIDPQLTLEENGVTKRFSIWNVIESYQSLFTRAVKCKGNIQPYIQQLERYDEREIQEYKTARDLSANIAVRSLQSGMMKGTAEKRIKEQIKKFLSPKETKSHGRPIYAHEAQDCGLKITVQNFSDSAWEHLYELYLRTYHFTQSEAAKSVENKKDSFFVPMHRG